MKASRRDFEAMAKLLAEHKRAVLRGAELSMRPFLIDRHYVLCKGVGEIFKTSNPAFQMEKFLTACEAIE